MKEIGCRAVVLLALSILTALLAGCDRQFALDEFAVDECECYEPEVLLPPAIHPEHGLELNEEELAVLQERQTQLTKAWKNVVEAASAFAPHVNLKALRGGPYIVDEDEIVGPVLEWSTLMDPIWENTIGYAWEGRQGELVHSRSYGADIHIVQVANGLEFIRFDEQGYPFIHAVVRPGNEIILNPSTNVNRNTRLAPRFWRIDLGDDNTDSLSEDSPVLYAGNEPPNTSQRPRLLGGWLFPTRSNNFVCFSLHVTPIEGAIWVGSRQDFNVIEFFSRDSVNPVLHAKVLIDGTIKFSTPFEWTTGSSREDGRWGWFDDRGEASFIPREMELIVLDERFNEVQDL